MDHGSEEFQLELQNRFASLETTDSIDKETDDEGSMPIGNQVFSTYSEVWEGQVLRRSLESHAAET